MKKQKFLTMVTGGCFLIVCIFSTIANAAWYNVKVTQIVPKGNGDTMLQMIPGSGETRFTDTARAYVPGTSTGGNKMVAVILTAATLESEMSVYVENTPSWETAQPIGSISLITTTSN